jgi:hypothetical protein
MDFNDNFSSFNVILEKFILFYILFFNLPLKDEKLSLKSILKDEDIKYTENELQNFEINTADNKHNLIMIKPIKEINNI